MRHDWPFHIARSARWTSIGAMLLLAALAYLASNYPGEKPRAQITGLMFTIGVSFAAGRLSRSEP